MNPDEKEKDDVVRLPHHGEEDNNYRVQDPPPPPHPMIPVPEAIRIVLRETARRLYNNMHRDGGSSSVIKTNQEEEEESVLVNHHLVGRVVAHDIVMPAPGYPPFAASILDGYAVRRRDLDDVGLHDNDNDRRLTIIGRVHAGDDPDHNNNNNDGWSNNNNNNSAQQSEKKVAVYVTTGAKIPNGLDCVVAVEDTTTTVVVDNNDSRRQMLLTVHTVPTKSWIRAPGSDIAAGTVLMRTGDVVSPVEVGMLLQAGMTRVKVRRRIRVTVVSSGNELVDVVGGGNNNDKNAASSVSSWLTNGNGTIPDVNGPMLMGLLSNSSMVPNGCVDAVYYGVVRDDSEITLTAAALRQAAHNCDVLITTGGISVGATDRMEQCLVHHLGGILHFGRLHMKPGKPSTFLTLPAAAPSPSQQSLSSAPDDDDVDDTNHNNQNQSHHHDDTTLVFCLPGNPVSAYVCAHLLVQPCLDLLCRGLPPASSSSSISAATSLLLPAAPTDTMEAVVENAQVVSETSIRLSHDIPLDRERPEYHRVVTDTTTTTSSIVSTTGNQQSSRLLSCQHSVGLVVLPQGTEEKPVAKQGERYPLLKIHDPARIRVGDSIHLRRPRHDDDGADGNGRRIRVTLLQWGDDLDPSLADDVFMQRDLRPTATTAAAAVATTTTARSATEEKEEQQQQGVFHLLDHRLIASIPDDLTDDDWSAAKQDLTIIVASQSLRSHSLAAAQLRSKLTKCADAMALRVLQHCCSNSSSSSDNHDDADAAYMPVRDCVIGSRGGDGENNQSCLVVYISSHGLRHGLPHLRDVLIQAVRVANGTQR